MYAHHKKLLIIGSIALALGVGYRIGVVTSTQPDTNADAHSSTQTNAPSASSHDSIIVVETNPLDDSKSYGMTIKSTNQGANAIGMRERAVLKVRCRPDGKDVYLDPPEFMASSKDHRVVLRWDGGDQITQTWAPAAGGGATFSRAPMSLLSTMTMHDELVIGYQPYNKIQTAAVFNLKKHRKDLKAMQSHCR